MTTAVAVTDAEYPTPDEVRDILLRTLALSFKRRGLVANVLPGSDHYIRATAYARRVSIAIANNQLALADINPLSAQGVGLITLAGIFGVTARPAAGAAGAVLIKCTGTVTIPAGFVCVAPDGHQYKTIAATTLTTGQSLDVIAVLAGKTSDQSAATRCTWLDASIGTLNPICTVASGGLTGGSDGDVTTNTDGSQNVEQLRTRLLRKLAFPGVGGNWSQVVEWAEEATSSVELAYVYPAVRGPGSYDVAVTKAAGNRTLTSATISTVRAYINSLMPGQNDLNVTSVAEQRVDVTVVASLPLPQSAGGAGGGWRDASPWPAENAKVTVYNAGTGVATVNTTTAPVAGNAIGVWDPDALDADSNPAPTMKEFAVATVTGTTGAWNITVQGGFGFNPLGAYVSAGAVHLTEYAEDLLAQFEALGPGEKSVNPDIVPRGKRAPTTDVQAPSAIASRLLSVVQGAHDEIADLTYGVRYLTGTTTPTTGAAVALAPGDPPFIVTLRYLALHP